MWNTSSENGYVSITDLNNCMATLGNLEWEKARLLVRQVEKEIASWDTNASLGKINFNKGGLNGGTNKAKPLMMFVNHLDIINLYLIVVNMVVHRSQMLIRVVQYILSTKNK